jgi:hypothetical protein
MADKETIVIHELRVYHAQPGRLPELVTRFRDHTVLIFNRLGIRQVGYWTTMIGESETNALTYLLAWNSLAEREEKWAVLKVDPEWISVRDKSEEKGPLVSTVNSQLLEPTDFSKLQ